MGKFTTYIRPAERENCVVEVLKRKENSAYENELVVDFRFYARPAQSLEKKAYRLQKGVDMTSSDIFIVSSNLPDSVKDGDAVMYLGKKWVVTSVGYYLDQDYIINSGIMSDDYLKAHSKKGLTLK